MVGHWRSEDIIFIAVISQSLYCTFLTFIIVKTVGCSIHVSFVTVRLH